MRQEQDRADTQHANHGNTTGVAAADKRARLVAGSTAGSTAYALPIGQQTSHIHVGCSPVVRSRRTSLELAAALGFSLSVPRDGTGDRRYDATVPAYRACYSCTVYSSTRMCP